MNTLRKVGLWSAVISAICSLLWFVTFVLKDAIAPMPPWSDLPGYAAAFSPLRVLYLYPSLILPLSFLAMLAAIHLSAAPDKRIWSLIALSFGIVYATMASVNYNIQVVAVRLSLAAGETGGIEMFVPDNPNSIFNALANSYIYISLAMFAAGFVFENHGLQRWVRWIFFAQLITALGQIGASMFDLGDTLLMITGLIWAIGAPVAFGLVGVVFARGSRNQGRLQRTSDEVRHNEGRLTLGEMHDAG